MTYDHDDDSSTNREIVYTKTTRTIRQKSCYRYRDSSLPPSFREKSAATAAAASTMTTGEDRTDKTDNAVVKRRANIRPIVNSSSQNDFHQHQRQSHDSSDGYNNGKVRIIVSPASAAAAASTTTTTATGSGKLHTVRSATMDFKQPQSRQQLNEESSIRQKNYHHYDYYTDSNLTSSIPFVSGNQKTAGSHYEENLMLFATEHNNNNDGNSNRNQQQQQPQQPLRSNVGYNQHQPVPVSIEQRQRVGGNNSNNNFFTNTNTGRFVNYYPSWRQTQSPTTSQYHNYSFHVPLNQQQTHLTNQYNSSGGGVSQLYQSPGRGGGAGGYVGPNEMIYAPDSKLSRSFKSRTIAHIPNMVKVSAEDGGCGSNYDPYNEGSYETKMAPTKQLMVSEGNLVRAHLVRLHDDDGSDNPFKPGTELSWEADLMVRLMKRGYPLKELPILVETAKQVAREKGESSLVSSPPLKQRYQQYTSEMAPKTISGAFDYDRALLSDRVRAPEKELASTKLVRRLSSTDLNCGKQIWADSLSRTKSMTGFYRKSTDADSIDKLITSIENEMADLLSLQEANEISGVRSRTNRSGSSVLDKSINKLPNKKTSNKVIKKKQSKQWNDEPEQQVVIKSATRNQVNLERVNHNGVKSNSQADLSVKKKLSTECCRIQ